MHLDASRPAEEHSNNYRPLGIFPKGARYPAADRGCTMRRENKIAVITGAGLGSV